MKTRSYTRYSEAFKHQVVQEIESGKFSSAHAAARAYGIPGMCTVANWLRKYGRKDLIPKKISITTMSERDENQELKKRVSELEKALADAYMQGLLNESYFELACERLNMDPEAFKKKHVSNLSSVAKRKGKQ
jgi:transposase-like protein